MLNCNIILYHTILYYSVIYDRFEKVVFGGGASIYIYIYIYWQYFGKKKTKNMVSGPSRALPGLPRGLFLQAEHPPKVPRFFGFFEFRRESVQ